jgi:hypothetical protein
MEDKNFIIKCKECNSVDCRIESIPIIEDDCANSPVDVMTIIICNECGKEEEYEV